MLPDQGQHVVLYTGGGFTPGAKVITSCNHSRKGFFMLIILVFGRRVFAEMKAVSKSIFICFSPCYM